MTRLETLKAAIAEVLGESAVLSEGYGELTVVVAAADLPRVALTLRDDARLRFDTAVDLCGVDYLEYGEGEREGPRFASVLHLLSVEHNWRVRVRSFAPDDEFPVVPTLTEVWPSLGWFERESFDLFGIVYEGHPDLRRILTDYGFVGHPFRKDFPVYGHVEMRYDPEQKRVIYQPVSIEPRENIPRVIREEGYGTGR
jgi:NADH-quinone oxidoreductase subunit C